MQREKNSNGGKGEERSVYFGGELGGVVEFMPGLVHDQEIQWKGRVRQGVTRDNVERNAWCLTCAAFKSLLLVLRPTISFILLHVHT